MPRQSPRRSGSAQRLARQVLTRRVARVLPAVRRDISRESTDASQVELSLAVGPTMEAASPATRVALTGLDEAGAVRVSAWLRADGYTTVSCDELADLLTVQQEIDVVVLQDHHLTILTRVAQLARSCRVLVAAPAGVTDERLDDWVRHGASGVLRSPLRRSPLLLAIRTAERERDLSRALARCDCMNEAHPAASEALPVVPIRELERRAIEHALRATGGSVGKAAKLLGIGRATLYRRIASFEAHRIA